MHRPMAAITLLALTAPAWASDPPPVPLTRPEMKRLLEESKRFAPRLTAPKTSAEELAAAKGRGGSFSGTSGVRNLIPPELQDSVGFFMTDGRLQEMSAFALRNPNAAERPGNWSDRSSRIERDPNMTMEWSFRTMLFWIVSRSNNCIYCMGHQESSLPRVGVTEDRIAALDGDWSEFTLAERAAFALARKLTVAPQTVSDADIDAVRRHYTDLQVLEMIGLVAGFNAMNRWTGPLRLTQEDFRVFLTPTSAKYASTITKIGPVPPESRGTRCAPMAAPRPALEPRAVVEQKWDECRTRKSRFALVDEPAARALLPEHSFPTDEPLPNWVRLLANFPKAGMAKIAGLRASETKGRLSPKLNAQLAWVSARADRAWYALAYARDRLFALGLNDDTVFAIDEANELKFTPAERAAFAFTRKLTVDPALIADDDFDVLRKYYSDAEIAELIHHVNHDVFFNRLTEAAHLPLDGVSSGAPTHR
jgi:alkylhydroperoxidase family enzyme